MVAAERRNEAPASLIIVEPLNRKEKRNEVEMRFHVGEADSKADKEAV